MVILLVQNICQSCSAKQWSCYFVQKNLFNFACKSLFKKKIVCAKCQICCAIFWSYLCKTWHIFGAKHWSYSKRLSDLCKTSVRFAVKRHWQLIFIKYYSCFWVVEEDIGPSEKDIYLNEYCFLTNIVAY